METPLKISNLVNSLTESATMAMSKLARELTAQGNTIINLSIGEPDFNTPDFIKHAAICALSKNLTHYTPVAGFLDLRKAIVKKLKTENNLDYLPSQIVVSTGAKQSLMNAVFSVVNPGDEVIVPTPFWGSYSEIIKLAGGVPVYIAGSMDNDFKITPEQLKEHIGPKTKLFMFSSPNNPTGSIYSKYELEGLVRVFEEYQSVYILSDEIYEHINYIGGHESIAQFPSIKERVLLINGFSKAYAMTGWRLGYLASNETVSAAVEKLQGQVTSGTSSISQMAGIAAYSTPTNSVTEMNKAFRKRRDLMLRLLCEIPGLRTNLPSGAFYFFPEISSFFGAKTPDGSLIKNSQDLAYYLLFNAQVATVAGDSFGNDNHIRLAYTLSEHDLIEGLERITAALKLLR